MPTHPTQHRNAPSGAFGSFLFAVMVGIVATVVTIVMYEGWGLSGAIGLGALIGTIVFVALILMLRKPLPPMQESADAFEDRSTFRTGEMPEGGQGVGGHTAPGATTTQDTLAVGGATGGTAPAAVAATPEARAPGEPAERPLPGAGAPAPVASDAEEAAARATTGGADAAGGSSSVPVGDHHGAGDPGGVDPGMPVADGGATDGAARADAAAAFAEAPAVEEKRPEMLAEARDGGPDDLKKIRGVGPKLESMLHGMGIYHFDQIAGWGPSEVAWADSNLEGFKGRVSRDDWVGQSRTLAAGGETEFSAKQGG